MDRIHEGTRRMSLVDDRANIIADLENDLQRTREAWKYYKQLMLRNTLEGWERVDSGLQAVATSHRRHLVTPFSVLTSSG